MPAIGFQIPILRKSGSTDVSSLPAGWVGSKVGLKHDLVTIDSNGRADQIVATSTAVTSATGRVGALNTPQAVGNVAGTSVTVEKFDDDTLIDLQAADAAGAAVVTTNAMVGKLYPLFRTAAGIYVINTASNTNPVVEVVNLAPYNVLGESGGYLQCRILAASRLS